MATQFSMLGIMNAALVSRGLDEIVSENDGTAEFILLSRNWPGVVESELEAGFFNFTKVQTTLVSRQDGLFGFDDSYLLPGDCLHVRRLWVDVASGSDTYRNLDVPWVQDDRAVHVDQPSGVMIEYVRVADPAFWSATFSRGIQLRLEAIIARSVWEEDAQAAALNAEADRALQLARAVSSKSRSATEPYRASRFARARFGLG